MNRSDRVGKIQTVLGGITPEDLGITMAHEHCLVNGGVCHVEPIEPNQRALAHQPITLENIAWVRRHPLSHHDNMRLLDEELAIKELRIYKRSGGNSIVDVTPISLGRDPLALKRISQATDLNIIMGSGYYSGPSHPPELDRKTEEEVAEEIARDIIVGVGDTGVRAGIIGEIGCSWPLMDREHKILRAAARAQQLTGAPISIHPGRHESSYLEELHILGNAGADLTRTIICHFDRGLLNSGPRLKLKTIENCAKTGCYIEYDNFGLEGACDCLSPVNSHFNWPVDSQREDEISYLIDKGYLNQILIAQDCCMKMRLCHYGGHGYAHILNTVLPWMRQRGISNAAINTILVDNPKRVLTFI